MVALQSLLLLQLLLLLLLLLLTMTRQKPAARVPGQHRQREWMTSNWRRQPDQCVYAHPDAFPFISEGKSTRHADYDSASAFLRPQSVLNVHPDYES